MTVTPQTADLIIIGAGPGGYVAAIRAAQLGMRVVVIDKRPVAGGTCLNVGCIPSKALLNASHKYWEAQNHLGRFGIMMEGLRCDLGKMLANKDSVVDELTKGISFLFKKNKVTFVNGMATFAGEKLIKVVATDGTEQYWEAPSILIATGSESTKIPTIPVDEQNIISSTGALNLSHVPKHLVVIGGGYIGLELGSVWLRLGSTVTVVEYMDRIAGVMDQEMAHALHKELESQGMVFKLSRKVASVQKVGTGLVLSLLTKGSEKGAMPEMLSCDVALVSVGRRPLTEGLGLDAVDISVDERGFIQIDENFQTTCPGVYAIGDVVPGLMLAHRAQEEGVAVVENLAGQSGHVNYDVIPAVIFTAPEVASVGKTEEELVAAGTPYKAGRFPFLANSRAKAMGETAGFVKILVDAQTDRILGVHIIGEMAGTMIAEAAMAMELGASAEDIARTCHAHPTHSEALKEAGWAAFDRAIHA